MGRNMDKTRLERLVDAGWRVGSAAEFLGLSEADFRKDGGVPTDPRKSYIADNDEVVELDKAWFQTAEVVPSKMRRATRWFKILVSWLGFAKNSP